MERYEQLYASGAYLPADERRTIEVAAGAPWARRAYANRFRHRTPSGRRPRAPRPAGGDGGSAGEVRPAPQGSLF